MAKRISKFLSAMLVIALVVSMIPAVVSAATADVLYLCPNSNWLEADARFAAYFFGNGEIWVDCVDSNGDGIYEVEVPAGYTKVIFCRMNPNTTENTWSNKWNQTNDLDIPTDANVQYTVQPGTWDNGNGVWGPFGSVCDHTYVFGVCTKCGDVDETYVEEDWYLYGYINGTNYDETSAPVEAFRLVRTGEYNSFGVALSTTQVSYVAVKNASNTKFYVTEGYQDSNSVTMYDSKKVSNPNMLRLPVSGKVIVTMQFNNDGTMTLSYTAQTTGVCEHPSHDQNGYCTVCHYDVPHTYVNGKCSVCGKVESGATCSHNYVGTVTKEVGCVTDGIMTYTCSKCSASYTEAIPYVGHSYNYGTCDKCGEADPYYTPVVLDYYLFGWINGADYGCGDDWENMGEYKFVNGKLTASFAQDSYIAVKDSSNANWYMFNSYVDTTSGTLYNTNTGSSEKMFVPGGVTLNFTLVENGDGTLSLSYTTYTGTVTVPTLTLNYPSLSFEDEILYNVYYSIDNTTSVVEMGLVTFSSKLANGTIANAVDVFPGYVNSGSTYMAQTDGIPAKNLGDAVYFKVYAKLADGSYVYSEVAGYNAVAYANTVLGKSTSTAKAKALVVAMLNYGAAAQTYFGYKTNSLMNANLTSAQKALVSSYSSSMVADVVKANSSKVGSFVMNGGYSNIYPTVSFEGAFAINFYFTPNKTVDSAPTFYYWDAETYNSVSKLTAQNATGKITMVSDGKGNWGAAVEGIAAKDMDSTVYVAGIYTSNGTSYPTNVISYSLGNYCKTVAANGEAFGAATAVYGYYAKAYFA